MWKTFFFVVAAVIAGLLGYATLRPDTFEVRRTATVHTAPEKIAPLIGDFRQWAAWSPYEKLDPAMRRSFSGAASGPGAIYAWEGNSKAGAGRMEITEATPRKIAIQLDFIEPFEGHNVAEFALAPQGDATQLTWSMRGPSPYVAKLMGMFFNMDKMIGQDFEVGLANLKSVAEK